MNEVRQSERGNIPEAVVASLPDVASLRVGVVGLGYVGLPLALHLARHFPVIGFDQNQSRVSELARGHDRTKEATDEELTNAKHAQFTSNTEELRACNFFVISVPTPIDDFKRPDLRPLSAASRTVGSVLLSGNVVVFESTVYPGATEEFCVPLIEEASGCDSIGTSSLVIRPNASIRATGATA